MPKRPGADAEVQVEAVIFDFGDVLEVNPRTGWPERWAGRLGTDLDSFQQCLDEIWLLARSERRTLKRLSDRRLVPSGLMMQPSAHSDDAWSEYVGTALLTPEDSPEVG